MKLGHIAVVCSTQENADRFYKDLLGLEKIRSFTIDKELTMNIFNISCECLIIFYENENMAVEVFVPTIVTDKTPSFTHFCLETPERDQFLNRCEQAGLKISRIPKGEKILLFLEDFDGNYFEIK